MCTQRQNNDWIFFCARLYRHKFFFLSEISFPQSYPFFQLIFLYFFKFCWDCVHLGCLSPNELDFFFEKHKIVLRKVLFAEKWTFLPFFWPQSAWPFFFSVDICRFFNSSRKYVHLGCFPINELDFSKKKKKQNYPQKSHFDVKNTHFFA